MSPRPRSIQDPLPGHSAGNPHPRKPQLTAAFIAVALTCLGFPASAQEPPIGTVLTTAAQVRALSPERAMEQIPIRIRGCFMAREDNSFAMQDETDSLFVFTDPSININFERGDLIEVDGVTNPGDYAPCATAYSVSLVGKTTVPLPVSVTISDLFSGQLDAKWVELSGIVRSVEIVPSLIPKTEDELAGRTENLSTKVKLADGNSQLVVELQEVLEPSEYVDAYVRLRGHCFYLHNGNRQFVRPILHVPTGIKPIVLEPPLHDDFGDTPKPVASLFTYDHEGGNPGHRVHVRGVVTHQRPGKAIWIRDEVHSLQVQTSQTGDLAPGDVVDVLGFPEPGTYSPILQDAIFKKASEAALPIPVELEELSMITRHDSDFVKIEGTLTEVQRYPESIELTLDALGTTVRASLFTGVDAAPLPSWQPGVQVEVSGIATVGEGETIPLNGLWWSESLHILLRSTADLTVLVPAPWWTAKRISYALAGFLALAICVIAITVLLSRRRLREQHQQRAMAESEFSAILNERNRVAREIHDTLAQNIGAISVQLELVRPDARNLSEVAQKHIQTAHKLARTALSDARDSIWNMRSQILEKYILGEALQRIASQLTDDTEIEAKVEVVGTPRRLPPVVENNLLRIGQEAIANACKHANPTRILVTTTYQVRSVEVVVEDNGKGFGTSVVSENSNRSFGLVGIRERVELLGGTVEIKSVVNKGTRIRVLVND